VSVAVQKRGTWVAIKLIGGQPFVRRFSHVSEPIRAGERWWLFDRGAYGKYRDDGGLRESDVESATPAMPPLLLLTFRDCNGRKRRAGHYASEDEAAGWISFWKNCVSDIRFEATPHYRLAAELVSRAAAR